MAYIVAKARCIHPFRISRVLVLANWKAMEKHRDILAEFKIQGFEAGFFIEGLKELLNKDRCFHVNEKQRCVEYVCNIPSLSELYREIIDEILEETNRLDDKELNGLVIRDKRYHELLARGGFA